MFNLEVRALGIGGLDAWPLHYGPSKGRGQSPIFWCAAAFLHSRYCMSNLVRWNFFLDFLGYECHLISEVSRGLVVLGSLEITFLVNVVLPLAS
ncbi:hypothetical protein AVEN_60864-1 [Araneus ventricosus]|uniref:Uncharacterized protein n=1 Tax=Araneus ventricosus TaxID=182803 RepID=A0A4Y2IQH5_ARAVE|nr:hypothetical protein AVEN_60864-1 [Araneus ventricosus]